MCIYSILGLVALFITLVKSVEEIQQKNCTRHAVVRPVLQHGRTKREMFTAREEHGSHHLEVAWKLLVDGKEYILDLRLNLDLITANHVLSYQENGRTLQHKFKKEEINLCHYTGSVRGVSDSWAAVSTCDGIQALIFDGTSTRYMDSAEGSDLTAKYNIYDIYNLLKLNPRHYNRTRNVRSTDHYGNRLNLRNRDVNRASKGHFYVELALVADRSYFEAHHQSLSIVHTEMQKIANILDTVFSKLNISIALVGVEVWNEYDTIPKSTNTTVTLMNFLEYREKELLQSIPNDNAQLLTLTHFGGSVVGKALRGAICTRMYSGGMVNTGSKSTGLVAMMVAHELGHNFGLNHDDTSTDTCRCQGEQCIMWPYITQIIPTGWSSCSLRRLHLALSTGIAYCLRNKPVPLIDLPICGNSTSELGQQCDCDTVPVADTTIRCRVCCDICCHLEKCKNHKCRSLVTTSAGITINDSTTQYYATTSHYESTSATSTTHHSATPHASITDNNAPTYHDSTTDTPAYLGFSLCTVVKWNKLKFYALVGTILIIITFLCYFVGEKRRKRHHKIIIYSRNYLQPVGWR